MNLTPRIDELFHKLNFAKISTSIEAVDDVLFALSRISDAGEKFTGIYKTKAATTLVQCLPYIIVRLKNMTYSIIYTALAFRCALACILEDFDDVEIDYDGQTFGSIVKNTELPQIVEELDLQIYEMEKIEADPSKQPTD